jgi:RNA 3'-terminal phosphate cyclase-like protein
MLRLRGDDGFRARLVLATIAGRSIRIDGIREHSAAAPGLRPHEASFLRLLEKVTHGASVEINETGTSLRYRPGVIVGGTIEHDCPPPRGVGYYAEPLLLLALFARAPLRATLRGVTNGGPDPSADAWRVVGLPLLRRVAGLGPRADAATALAAGAAAGDFALRVVRRGLLPHGGGEIVLEAPRLACIPPVDLVDEGAVRRVRGVAHAARVPPAAAAAAVDGVRGVLNALLADVYVFTDHAAGQGAARDPGYGVMLVAETTTGCLLGCEVGSDADLEALEKAEEEAAEEGGGDGDAAPPSKRAKSKPAPAPPATPPPNRPRKNPPLPRTVGVAAARGLLAEVARGGVCDAGAQGLLLLTCALADAQASRVRLGPLTPHAAACLRAARDVLGVTFSLKPDRASGTVFASCVGAGVRNSARTAT